MSFSGGTFSRLYSWVNDRNNGINITASRMDAEMDGFATGLSKCLLKDGTQTVTANIPMATFKFTGLGAGTANGDSVRYEQVVLLSAGGNQTITQSAAGTLLTLESTDAGASTGPALALHRNSASPANSDVLGSLNFDGKDSGGTQTTFARIQADIGTVTDTSEEGRLYFGVVAGGTLANKLRMDGTSLIPFVSGAMALGSSSSVFGAAYLTTVELGHASDTTLARASAGLISVEGVTIEPGASRCSFSAHKNGSSQAINTTTVTKLTFGTEVFDVGSKFASSTWTPVSGTVLITAGARSTGTYNATEAMLLLVYKNGSAFKISQGTSDTAAATVGASISFVDQANGTDTYEVYVQSAADTTWSITGSSDQTFFTGTMV